MKYLNNFESFNESVDTVGSTLHTAIKNKSKQIVKKIVNWRFGQ